jgi:hypothetical protein
LGEVVFEGLASNADTRLRTHESEVLSDAETAAGNANERASNLEDSTTQLQIELQKQEQATAKAAEEAALANAKLGGWKLDEAAKRRFAGQVKKFPGTPFDLAVNPVEALSWKNWTRC